MGSCSKPRVEVCVIGAGMSGLAAARELRREGHAVTVMEQSAGVGGQWLYDPRTDADDPLGSNSPVKFHSSMYASVRVLSPRECMGFSDFQFVPRPDLAGGERDPRRFPGHREVHRYLKDFCTAFGLDDAIRLNTRVLQVAPMEGDGGDSDAAVKWKVRSLHVNIDGEEEDKEEEEVFDAVVVANGHYSQPRLPSIDGMDTWPRRQLHSHSYREPDPFRGEVVVVVGSGESGLDIATELSGVAKEVHLATRSTSAPTTPTPSPTVTKMLVNHAGIRLHAQVSRLCADDGAVEFADGSRVAAVDTVIYCTGYTYSIPFLDTGGAVTVRGDRGVGPLYEHTFPPALAPTLSFVGLPQRVFAPWVFEAQARWVALVLSGKVGLPTAEEMMRAANEDSRAREVAGVPEHDIPGLQTSENWEFVYRHSNQARMEEWKVELFWSSLMNADRDTFRDRQDDSDNVREGVRTWRCVSGAQYEAALADAAAAAAHGGGPVANT